MPLKRGLIYHDIGCVTAMTAAERKSDFKLTKVTEYIALTGELWGVYYENFKENWQRYNDTALNIEKINYIHEPATGLVINRVR